MEVEGVHAGGCVAGETSEANFDENVVREETSATVDVTANFGEFSALDKGGASAESGGRRTEDRGRREGEPSAGGGLEEVGICGASWDAGSAKSRIANPGTQALPVRVSKRERRRIRREMERREFEKRIEKLRTAGGASAAKMIETVLAASPRVRGELGFGDSKQGASDPLAGADRDRSGRSSIGQRPRSP